MDAHSKWGGVIDKGKSTTATSIMAALRYLFAAYRLPDQVVSDNGPKFISEGFTKFLPDNGVKHS